MVLLIKADGCLVAQYEKPAEVLADEEARKSARASNGAGVGAGAGAAQEGDVGCNTQ